MEEGSAAHIPAVLPADIAAINALGSPSSSIRLRSPHRHAEGEPDFNPNNPTGQCTLNSGDYRKVTSHVFGRNKREIYQIPEEGWIKYC
ncbi:MAG: hypothetical protein Q9226_004482, partial [Calogaya cf. arnoldii]